MVDANQSSAEVGTQHVERERPSRRRLILAGAVGAAAAALVRGEETASAYEGLGDQGYLRLGSNDFLIAPNNTNNDAAVSSVATVIKASPNFGNFSATAGAHVFKADASPATGSINGLEGVGSGSGAGVVGICNSGLGMLAIGEIALYAMSSGAGYALLAAASGGPAVHASATEGIGGEFRGGTAPLRLVPKSSPGAPATGAHTQGELVVDSGGLLFLCKTGGTPGTWVQVSEQAVPGATPAPAGSMFQTLPTPERFIDTRSNLGGVQGPVSAGTTSTFQMTGRNGESGNPALQIPATATAIVGNLSVIGSAGAPVGSFVTMWPSGARPTTSSISFGPGAIVANAYTCGLGGGVGGQKIITVFAQQACDYIVDVVGFFG